MLADVLGRDGAELSATEIRHRNLVNADHLGILNAVWTAETREARHDRYRELVAAALPPCYRQPLSDRSRWLFRTLRAAELAGLNPAEVIGTAIGTRDLAGSRDIAAVLDARIRRRVYPLLPQPQASWAERVPHVPDPDRHAYLTEIAAMMDDRKHRLGQHAAQTTPAWAIAALGPISAESAVRQEWERKAASIGAYRETYGYEHPNDPIGPEPCHEAPEQRAAWHEAFFALGSVNGPDVRAMPDGQLWLIRDTYAAETAWAPRHVGRELRVARLGAVNADLAAVRADAETDAARKAADRARAGRHEQLAASYRVMGNHYRRYEATFAQTMADRSEWEHATAQSRRLAIAADAELRRRRPGQRIEPLRSAEPGSLGRTDRDQESQITGQAISQESAWIQELAAQRETFRAKIEERQGLSALCGEPDLIEADENLPAWRAPGRDAILHPPKPQIGPSARIPQLTRDRDIEPEATD